MSLYVQYVKSCISLKQNQWYKLWLCWVLRVQGHSNRHTIIDVFCRLWCFTPRCSRIVQIFGIELHLHWLSFAKPHIKLHSTVAMAILTLATLGEETNRAKTISVMSPKAAKVSIATVAIKLELQWQKLLAKNISNIAQGFDIAYIFPALPALLVSCYPMKIKQVRVSGDGMIASQYR
jgi:hypothetical protein